MKNTHATGGTEGEHAAPSQDRRTNGTDGDPMALGVMGREELLLVPRWVVRQLYDPTTPGRLRQAGSEAAREYLRTTHGVQEELTVFWWGTLQKALVHAARHVYAFVPPDYHLTDRPANG